MYAFHGHLMVFSWRWWTEPKYTWSLKPEPRWQYTKIKKIQRSGKRGVTHLEYFSFAGAVSLYKDDIQRKNVRTKHLELFFVKVNKRKQPSLHFPFLSAVSLYRQSEANQTTVSFSFLHFSFNNDDG